MAKCVPRLIGAEVIAEPQLPYHIAQHPEKLSAYLEEFCREFHAFIRDHRSQDPVHLHVRKLVQNQCSECGRTWEVDEGSCAWCGESVDAP